MSSIPWLAVLLMASVPALAGANEVIVVTAPRLDDLDLMAVDTAADVTVIDQSAIEQSGAVSVPELLRTEANVLVRNLSGNPNDSQISMRGFGDNSHLRTLVLVDGHRLNRPDMGGIGWQSVPVSNIERIEVIRGGQNVLYGDRAVGGVVKITTKSGADAGTRFGGSIGTLDYVSGYAGQGGALGDLDYSVGIDGYESGGFRTNSASRATSVFAGLVWYTGDAHTLSFRVSHTDSEMQFPGPLSYADMMRDPKRSDSDGSDRSEMEDTQVTLISESERGWGAFRISSGVNHRDLAWMQGGVDAENRQIGASLGPRVRWGGEDEFLMGGVDLAYDSLNFERFDSQPISGLRRTTSEADLERQVSSPYVFAQREAGGRITVNGGARYEHARTDARNRDYVDDQLFPTTFGQRGGESPNPSYQNPPDLNPTNSYEGVVSKEGWAAEASLVYEINEDWSAWAGYDRVYRYPVLDEMAAYQGYALSDPLNEKLDPETGHQFEIGAGGKIGTWSVSGTAFYSSMDNEIVFVENTNNNTQLNANLGATRRSGAEGGISLDRTWYGASTRWTIQDARLHGGEKDGNRVPLVPWNHGVVSAWLQPDDSVRLTLSYSYVSEQYQGNDEENAGRIMDAYGLLDFRINVAITDYARVEVMIDNLLNETYAPVAYGGSFYPGTGRSFRTGLHVEF